MVGVQAKANKGKFQLAINGAKQGLPQDEYSATNGFGARDFGTVYLNSGNQAFNFTVTGKNPGSTGYTLGFDYIDLIPTNRDETESLAILQKSAAPEGVFRASGASAGGGSYFNATAPGQSITYDVPVPPRFFNGYYVSIGLQTKPNKGQFQVSIDGVNYGTAQDEYSPAVGYGETDWFGPFYQGSTNTAIRFTVIGKNPK